MINPNQWYEGTVTEVHPHYRWMWVRDDETGKTYKKETAFETVHLELTVDRNKKIKFQLDHPDHPEEVKKIEAR